MPIFAAFTIAEAAAAAEAIAVAEAAAQAAAIAEAAAAAEAAATAAAAAEAAAAASAAAPSAGILGAEAGTLATTAPNAGILGAEIGASATPLAPAAETTAAGLETITGAEAATPLTPAAETAPYQFTQAELDAMASGQEMAATSSAAPPAEVTAYASPNGTSTSMLDARPVEPLPETWADLQAEGEIFRGQNPLTETWSELQANRAADPNAYKGEVSDRMLRGDGFDLTGGIKANIPQEGGYNLAKTGGDLGMKGSFPPAPAESGFMKGISSAMDWMDKNPFKTAIGAYGAAQKLGLLDEEEQEKPKPYSGILSKYKMSSDFKGRQANPQDYQYTPKVYNMASGGIASYRRGGDLSKELDYYEKMTQTKAPPAERGDPGIYYDLDPDTRYQDALTAAQIRQAKVNKRANLQVPGMKRPTPMGQLNLVPVTMKASPNAPDTTEAAQGGVMSLGGYAAGGNPRLLKGPGDGMSDNIPATIAGKQPARLADGEFVIPADVVSHLGNGSTEAGAKKLHKMMNDVRKARTGNPKQGKQINPNKFMPK